MPPPKKNYSTHYGKNKNPEEDPSKEEVNANSDTSTESENENIVEPVNDNIEEFSEEEKPNKKQKTASNIYKPKKLPIGKKTPCVVIFNQGEKKIFKSTA